jgi:hypothetical protein
MTLTMFEMVDYLLINTEKELLNNYFSYNNKSYSKQYKEILDFCGFTEESYLQSIDEMWDYTFTNKKQIGNS